MTELQTLLERAVDHEPEPVTTLDLETDLRRGRSCLRRRRTQAAGALAAVLALGLVGTGIARSPIQVLPAQHSDTHLVPAGAFEVPTPPAGWAVQAAGASLVVIAPDDLPHVNLSTPTLRLRLQGKLVLEYQSGFDGSFRQGETIEHDGRAFYTWVNQPSPDYPHDRATRMVSVRGPSGGWLVVQEAPALHWTTQQMIEFLDGVAVSQDAMAR
jgi:hypothetical protein